MARDRFQVLSIDGGGVRGIFVAAILAALEDDLGRPVADHFDVITGTSTGGIVALGLGAGLTPREILDFYVTRKSKVFSNPLKLRGPRWLWWAKYRARPLQLALQDVFGERLLGDSRTPLVIPSFDIGQNAVHLFKTSHHHRLQRDHRIPMWQVAMATSAAPTFFPTFRLPEFESRLVDGGVWANNPVMVGVTEAVSLFDQPLSSLRVLSLGTTSDLSVRGKSLDNAGLLRWARRPGAVDLLMRGQSVGALTQAQLLLGPENVHRIDPPVADQASLDHCDTKVLISQAAHYSRHFQPTFSDVFAEHSPPPFTPFHGINSEGAPPCS